MHQPHEKAVIEKVPNLNWDGRVANPSQQRDNNDGEVGLIAPPPSDDRNPVGVLRYLFMVGGASTFEGVFSNGQMVMGFGIL